MQRKVLVTGANGHIGNNLVRALVRGGDQVVAGVRNPSNKIALDSLNCRIANVDLLDKASIAKSLTGVEVLYQVGAVFRHWSKDPETDIYTANLEATRNVIEAAAEAGVRRLAYVSSLIALDRSILPITENSWNPVTTNVYARSKTDSEKLAWELAGKHGMDMVSVLPGATIGVNCFKMTPTMNLLNTVLRGKLAANPGFYFNFVDVEDIVFGLLAAAERGRAGERYLLANENCMAVGDVVRIAQGTFPERSIGTPGRPPRAVIWMMAALMEMVSKLRGQEPELQRNYLSEFTVREQ
jgi:dihydroflavonol-4-reductase